MVSSLKEILPEVMYNIMKRANKRDLLKIIIDNQDNFMMQKQAAKAILENNPTDDELSIVGEYVPQCLSLFSEERQMKIAFKESQ